MEYNANIRACANMMKIWNVSYEHTIRTDGKTILARYRYIGNWMFIFTSNNVIVNQTSKRSRNEYRNAYVR